MRSRKRILQRTSRLDIPPDEPFYEQVRMNRGHAMFNFDEASRQSKVAMDGMLKSYSEVASGFQAIATEAGDFYKKAFQDLCSYVEAWAGVRSAEAAYDLQASFAKSSCDDYIARATRISDIYADLAKAAYRPFEAPTPKPPAVVEPQAA
jgi:Phasin protein.